MVAPLVVLKVAQVAIPLVKKHPWIIPVTILIALIPIILLVILIGGLGVGISMISFPAEQQCEAGTQRSSVDALPDDMDNIKDIAEFVTECKSVSSVGFGSYIIPTEGMIYGFFGERGTSNPHRGIDFSAGNGKNVFAVADGVVSRFTTGGELGNYIEIDHGGGVISGYAHLLSGGVRVNKGDTVKQGQVIAVTGNTGTFTTGAHLHFVINVNGVNIDPLIFYLNSGINFTQTQGVALGSVYGGKMLAYCRSPEGIYFFWCPGFNIAKLTPGQGVIDSGSIKAYAQSKVLSNGWAAKEFTCLDFLWEKESNWNPSATNPSSGAYGIPQALPGYKMVSAGADWQTNPLTQINWGLSYIIDRYATPCAAWSHSQATDWY